MQVRRHAGLGAAVIAASLVALAPSAWCQEQSPDQKQQDQKPKEQKPQDQKAQAQKPAEQPQETDSLVEASRKAKANKPKTDETPADSKKVYTNEDLTATRKSGGISVVGSKNSGARNGANVNYSYKMNGPESEQYWRSRAQSIHDQMADVDKQMDALRDEIKKGGGAGFNVQSGLSNNSVALEDRNAKMKRLEQRKAELQKQLEALGDEARKADVPAGWVQ